MMMFFLQHGLAVWLRLPFLLDSATHFVAGMRLAPLPSVLVHVHAVVSLRWIVLFTTQISLVTTQHVNLHQRVGAFGFALAANVIILVYVC